MRLWTLHPRYLDSRGLVALWREALLARAVLLRRTRGYRHHPQLQRFRAHPRPVAALNAYLAEVCEEATRRGYRFDARKIGRARDPRVMPATRGQVAFEWSHLLRKLRRRSPEAARRWRTVSQPVAHPLFRIVRGRVEPWERLEDYRR